MGRAMLSKLLIQLSVDARACVPSLLFDPRPNYGGGNEDNGGLSQKVPCRHCCTQCPQPCSRPLLTHTSTRDSWTLTGNSGSVSCEVTAPFSWVLVCTRFVCTLQESVSPVLCKFCGGVNDHLLQKDLCQNAGPPRTVVLSAPDPWQATVDPHLHQRLLDTHRQVWLSLLWGRCSFLLGPGAHKVLLCPPRVPVMWKF